MIAIAAVDNKWGIGRDNKLLLSIPEDMKFFRAKTLGKTVVLGRKNLESFPGGKPLPKRRNIVLSRTLEAGDGFEVVRSEEELLKVLGETGPADPKNDDNVFVIGGSEVYALLLPMCTKAYITKMYRDLDPDCYFPDLDADPLWEVCEESDLMEYEGTEYRYITYRRRG